MEVLVQPQVVAVEEDVVAQDQGHALHAATEGHPPTLPFADLILGRPHDLGHHHAPEIATRTEDRSDEPGSVLGLRQQLGPKPGEVPQNYEGCQVDGCCIQLEHILYGRKLKTIKTPH